MNGLLSEALKPLVQSWEMGMQHCNTTIVENRLLGKKDTFACFIDFRKAFDCVDRQLLWEKLERRYSLGGEFLSAIKTLYSKVNCAVDVNHDLTDWFDVNSGVKQGCILSPTQFAMYIDDLVERLRTVRIFFLGLLST